MIENRWNVKSKEASWLLHSPDVPDGPEVLRPLSRLPVELCVRPAAVIYPGEPGQHRRGGARIAANGEAVGKVDPSRSFTLTTLNI